MPTFLRNVAASVASLVNRLALDLGIGTRGALLIDRGNGLLYDVERNITWLQDANYAKSIGRTPDGQLTWFDAQAWVASLTYRGIRGWRLPDARRADDSGPTEGENNADGEIGHLFLVANRRMAPPNLQLTNFEPASIYWYRNEASPNDAYAFRMFGLRQGRLAKNPWAGELPVPLVDKVCTWPVHDGDVGASFLTRLVSRFFASDLIRPR